MSESTPAFHSRERARSLSSHEHVWERTSQREAFERFFLFKKELRDESREFFVAGKRNLDGIQETSTLPLKETYRILNGARAQEKRLDAEVVREVEETEKKRTSLLRKWMAHPLFKVGVISAAIHGTLVAKGMSMPEELQKELPRTVLQPQSVAEMERVEMQRAERERRIDPEDLTAFVNMMRDRLEQGTFVSYSDLYFGLEEKNGVPSDVVEEGKRRAEDRVEQFSVSMGDDIDEEDLRGFVGVMYGPDKNYDWSQGSVAKYFTTGKRNCVAIAKGEIIVLEQIINRLPSNERARYDVGIQKIKQHEIATLTIHDREGGGQNLYLLELDDEQKLPVIKHAEEQPGSAFVSLDDLKHAMVATTPIVFHATGGTVANSPDLIASSNQPVNDGIIVEGNLRGSNYVFEHAQKQGIESVEVKQHDWGTTELSLTTPEEDAAFERKLKYGEDLALRDTFDDARRAVGFIFKPEGFVNATENETNDWFNLKGPISAEKVKKVNGWNDQEKVKYIYHGALHEFDDDAITEIVSTKAETVAALYLPEQNTEKIETLLDAAEGPNKPLVELQIREFELELGHVLPRSGEVRDEIRKIVARKNLESIAFVYKRFSVDRIESDPVAAQKKNQALNRLNARTAYDLANGKVKDVYLSGRTISPGDLLVLEHGKARIHVDLEEYVDLLLQHQSLLGSDRIVPWVRTVNGQIFGMSSDGLPNAIMTELHRLYEVSQEKPASLPDEPYEGMDF